MTEPVEYQRVADPHRHRRHDDLPAWQQLLAGLLLGAAMVVFLMLTICVPGNRALSLAKQAVCQSNLNTIGKAIDLYRVDHKQYPRNLADLVTGGFVPAKSLICPSTDRLLPPEPIRQSATDSATQPAATPAGPIESDYVYVPGLEFDVSANGNVALFNGLIRAFELPADHNQAGASVLYRGNVRFLTDLPQLLADLQRLNDSQAQQRRGNP